MRRRPRRTLHGTRARTRRKSGTGARRRSSIASGRPRPQSLAPHPTDRIHPEPHAALALHRVRFAPAGETMRPRRFFFVLAGIAGALLLGVNRAQDPPASPPPPAPAGG